MTKKQLKQRLMDMANGAEMDWREDDKCFYGLGPDTLWRFSRAVRDAFPEIPDKLFNVTSYFFTYWEDLDKLTNYIWDEFK